MKSSNLWLSVLLEDTAPWIAHRLGVEPMKQKTQKNILAKNPLYLHMLTYNRTGFLNYHILVSLSLQVWDLTFLTVCSCLKTLDTFSNCQRPVFSLGVSQHVHIITNLWKLGLNWSLTMQENNERKTTLVATICVLLDA